MAKLTNRRRSSKRTTSVLRLETLDGGHGKRTTVSGSRIAPRRGERHLVVTRSQRLARSISQSPKDRREESGGQRLSTIAAMVRPGTSRGPPPPPPHPPPASAATPRPPPAPPTYL